MELTIRKEISEDGIFYHIDGDKGERFAVTKIENYALLIASAPELLAACKMFVGFIPDGWEMPLGWGQVVAQAEETIIKVGKK